ncbi:hypothetical protein BABINDRAFT_38010 [Babjeviella inositovora NRRL Y-12698]|uniref:Vacuolar import/degradation Vid27 C-terminal domain-containing protein n=1 Tax=Babjeviella inositovora NRRL Y-12698 TaxID=984486 RepID=A0A1E3QN39_9ASCO|nr:uncharacterized protein BABINDRAFT_38010 [Babjeviella inositovora NRRL Y-12698]ODQ79091.1 hypothetical protein BABINDRAFT_38010 [Babjeviella inositovora NRRL Y-12698]
MNFLKKMLDSSLPKDEVAVIPSGQLYLQRPPNSPKGESECLYNDAILSICETSLPYHYQLVVQKAYQEGEEVDLDGDSDESGDGDDENSFKELSISKDDEWSFLIDDGLRFSKYTKDSDAHVLSWKDPEGDTGDRFEFVVDHTVRNSQIQQFMTAVYRCEYERKYRKSSISTNAADLAEFEVDYAREKASVVQLLGYESEDDFQDAVEAPVKAGTVVYQSEASLRRYSPESASFVLVDTVAVSIQECGEFDYALAIETPSVQCTVSSEMNPVFNFEHTAFIFNQLSDSVGQTWLLKFPDYDALSDFQAAFMKSLWESLNRVRWGKAKDDAEENYIISSMNDLELDDTELPDDDFDEEDEIEPLEFSRGDDEDDEASRKYHSGGEKNAHMAVGYSSDRTFVSRGNRLGVFRTDEDNTLAFTTAIENLESLNGKRITPAKMKLHMQDKHMIIRAEEDSSTLYKMDLERGKIVEEWSAYDIPIVEFGPLSKFGQTTSEETFLGISHSAIFRMDPRLSSRDKLVESELKNCATKNLFSALTTSENGYIAVASQKGDIRLYDRLGINAKTQLPALGDPITGLDVSADGRWLLATCKTYLLLIDTSIKEGKYSGELGFKRPFGKDSKPRPKRLTISPENLAFIQAETRLGLAFTKAHFNTGVEQTIITSSGPYVIVWSLKKILRGDKDPYHIKRYGQEVISDNFRYGTDKEIIVALEHDVAMVSKKALQKPTANSMRGAGIVKQYK